MLYPIVLPQRRNDPNDSDEGTALTRRQGSILTLTRRATTCQVAVATRRTARSAARSRLSIRRCPVTPHASATESCRWFARWLAWRVLKGTASSACS